MAVGANKQDIVTTSTTEAELLALAQAAKESLLVSRLLAELTVQLDDHRIKIQCDNKQTIRLVMAAARGYTQPLVTPRGGEQEDYSRIHALGCHCCQRSDQGTQPQLAPSLYPTTGSGTTTWKIESRSKSPEIVGLNLRGCVKKKGVRPLPSSTCAASSSGCLLGGSGARPSTRRAPA